ncbi:MAG TPA: invasin domain 3-containing protein [Anaerolineae bacterium]|nr:invasin domain 3-containing protein [Anaerolineae bacterium]
MISADAWGYGPSTGPGAGADGSGITSLGGGGGHGGRGGDASNGTQGGAPYGALYAPRHLGSGGGHASDYRGGAGGGAIHLIGATLVVNGAISANGANGNADTRFGSGGGAGGSIWVEVATLSGAGIIRANGGAGASSAHYGRGGGGAGGRIAIYAQDTPFTGAYQVNGGAGGNPGKNGTLVAGVDPLLSTVVVLPDFALADGVSATTVTVTARDLDGNPVAGVDVSLEVMVGVENFVNGVPVGQGVLTLIGATAADGTITATFASTEAEVKTVRAWAGDAPLLNTVNVTFVAGFPDADESQLEASPERVTADGVTTATVSLLAYDAAHNPVPGVNVVLTHTGASVQMTAPAPTGADGRTSVTVWNALPEVVTFTATANGVLLNDAAVVDFVAADLQVSKRGPAEQVPGWPVTYTLDIANAGLMTAEGVVVTDTLPAMIHFVTQTSAYPFTRTGNLLIWDLGDIPVGAGAVITMQTTVDAAALAGAALVNQVEARTATPEGKMSDNAAQWALTVGKPAPNLVVTPRYPTLVIPHGEVAVLTVTVRNAGTDILQSAQVTAPVHIPWVTILPESLGDLAPGASATFTVTADPPSGTRAGVYRDLFYVSSANAGQQYIALTARVQAPLRDIQIRVTNDGGASVPGVNLRLEQSLYVETEGAVSLEKIYQQFVVNQNGVMTATQVEAGDFTYHASAAGHQDADGVFGVVAGSGYQTIPIEMTADLSLQWEPAQPQLSTRPGQGVLRDVVVRNTSAITLYNVILTPPETLDWVFLGQNGRLDVVPPGATFTLTVHADPPEAGFPTLPQFFSDVLGVQADGGLSVDIPIAIKLFGDNTRTLQVTVVDPSGDPMPDVGIQLVSQQSYTVSNGTVQSPLRETHFGQSDANGQDVFPNMSLGLYSYYLIVDNIQAAAGALEVVPGEGTQEEVLVVPPPALSMAWTVEETPFEDVYTATLRLTFDPNASFPEPYVGPRDACFSETTSLEIVNAYPVTMENVELHIDFSCSVAYDPYVGVIPPNATVHVPVEFGSDCCNENRPCGEDPQVNGGIATVTGIYRHIMRAPLYQAAAPLSPPIQPGIAYDIPAKLVNEGYPVEGNLYGTPAPIESVTLYNPPLLTWITVTPTQFTNIPVDGEVDFNLHVEVPEWLQVGEYRDAVLISASNGITTALEIYAKMEPEGLTIETQFVTPLTYSDGSAAPGGGGEMSGGWDAAPWWEPEIPDYPEEIEEFELAYPLSRTCCRDCPHDPVHFWGWWGDIWGEVRLGPYHFEAGVLGDDDGLVRLEIVQRISLERQAFTARMLLAHNGGLPAEDVSVDIVVKDLSGRSWVVDPGSAQGGFLITPTLPSEMGDMVAGDRELANWIIIPDNIPIDPSTLDPYAHLEDGGGAFLGALGAAHPDYLLASDYVGQLDANIAQARAISDTDTLREERRDIIEALNEIALGATGMTFENFCSAATYVPDEFTPLETGARHLLARLGAGHPSYEDALFYQGLLFDNIAEARSAGDSEELQAARQSLLGQMNALSQDNLGMSFQRLSELPTGISDPDGQVFLAQAYVSYVVGDQLYILHTQEEPIVVKPQPFVWIEYFMPQYVWANEPFKLWALATNYGYGEARNLRINSAQPKILSNESGLPINFEIISPLEVNFGTLEPEESDKRFWDIVVNHDGEFIDFSVVCEHADFMGLDLSEQVYCTGNANLIYNPPTAEARNWGKDSPCATRQTQKFANDPVNTYSGNFTYNDLDVSIPTWGDPLMLERSYNSRDEEDSPLGVGWTHNYDLKLTYRSFLPISNGVPLGNAENFIEFKAPRGSRLYWRVEDDGSFTPYPGVLPKLERHLGTYTVTQPNQIVYVFNAEQLLVKQYDANKNVTEFFYDDDDHLIRVVGSGGRELTFLYNADGHIISMTDPLGRQTRYEYDAYGTLSKVIEPRGGETLYTYTGAGGRRQLESITDANGHVEVRNQYDNQGRVTRQWDAGGNPTGFAYQDGVTAVTDPLGNVTRDYYDEDGLLTHSSDAAGTEYYEYDDEYNRIAVVDKNGHRTEYLWDSCGCGMTEIEDPLGHTTRQSFDSIHRLTSFTDGAGRTTYYTYGDYADPLTVINPLGEQISYTYGTHGEVLVMQDAAGRVTRFEYNSYGDLVRTLDPAGNATLMQYDAAGRMLNTTNPAGYTTTFVYDLSDNVLSLTDPLGGVKSYTYDPVNNRLTATDANGHTTAYEYDSRNKLLKEINPLSGTTRYAYDDVGNKVQVTDANDHATLYAYDASQRVLSITAPEGGVTSFTYDPVGNLLTERDANGNLTRYTYDAANRIVALEDAAGVRTYFAHDGVGNQTVITDALGRVKRTVYDGLDRPVRVIQNEVDGVFDPARPDEDIIGEHVYDAAGNRVEALDMLGRVTRTEYDVLGHELRVVVNYVDGVYDPAHPDEDLVTLYAYDVMGNVISTTNAGGHTTQYTYDALNRRVLAVDPLGGKTHFAFDPVGNQIAVTDAASRTTLYKYDALDRMVSITDPLSGTAANTYDAVGNVLEQTDAEGYVITYTYDGANRRLTKADPLGNVTTYAYDPAGNRVRMRNARGYETRYTYDALNRVVSVRDPLSNTRSFTYDVLGNQLTERDEEGRVTTYEYGRLSRLVTTTNAMGGQIVSTYDAAGNRLSISDPAGRVTRFTYDALDRLVVVTDALSGTVTNTYDAMGNVLSTRDAAGRTTRFTYDALDRLLTTTDPLGGVYENRYDGVGNVVVEIDPLGRTTFKGYDARDRLITTTNALSGTAVNRYDAVDNLLAMTDAEGRVTTMTYDGARQLRTVTDPEGGVTAYAYDAVGNHAVLTDALGFTTTYTYDALNRLASETDALGQRVRYEYDAVGNAVLQTDARGYETIFVYDDLNRRIMMTDALSGTTSYVYDVVDNVIAERDANGDVTTYEYDDLDRLVTTTDPLGGVTHDVYDAVGNLIAKIDAEGRTTRYGYDPLDRLITTTNALGGQEINSYDAVGNLLAKTDAAGRTTTFTYDALDRMVHALNAAGGETTWTHDVTGNVLATTDAAGRTTTFAYDGRNRLITTTDPLSGTLVNVYDAVDHLLSTTDAEGRTASYTYDPVGRLLELRDGMGHVTAYTYDEAGNRTVVTDPNGHATRHVYDPLNRVIVTTDAEGHTTTFTYDGVGNLLSETDAEGHTQVFAYDALDRLLRWRDGLGHPVSYTYDAVGNQLTITDANGHTSEIAYDALNRAITATDALGGQAINTYDAVGNLVATTDAEGRTTILGYDRVDRLVTTTNALGGQEAHTYDRVGNLIASTDAEGNTTTFDYDVLDRLITTTNALGGQEVNVYDAVGNLLATTDAEGRTTQYAYDAADRLLTTTNALGEQEVNAYDAAGNVLSITDAAGEVSTFEYDAVNQLVRYTNVNGDAKLYAYDGVGNRTVVTDARGFATTYAYDAAGRLVSVTDALGQTEQYTYDPVGNRTAVIDARGNTMTYAYDALDRLSRTTDALGATTDYVYDAVGNLVGEQDALGHVSSHDYDALDRLIRTTDALGGQVLYGYDGVGNQIAQRDAEGRITLSAYDALNRRTVITDALGGVTRMTYDAVGNLRATTDAEGRATTFGYDGLDRLFVTTDALGGQTINTYDAVGNLIATTDAEGNTSTFTYDAVGRRLSVTNALGAIETQTYDTVGNPLTTTDAEGHMTAFAYDPVGRLITMTDALGGLEVYAYDAVGNRTAVTDADGNTSTFAYDEANRLTAQTDALGQTTRFVYDLVGNPIATVNAEGYVTTMTYDAINRLVLEVNALGGQTRYAYDRVGNRIAITDPEGRVTGFTYDALNRQVVMTDALGGLVTTTYDAVGNVLAEIDAEGRTTAYAYDALDRRTLITDALGGLALTAYDRVGNPVSRTDAEGRVTTLTYDAVYRLIATTDALSGVTTLDYDAVGNLVALGDAGGRTTSYAYDALNRVVMTTDALGGQVIVAYDAVGNKIAETDANGHTTTFSYDAAGQRIATTDAAGYTTAYIYDRVGNQIGERDANGNVTTMAYDGLGQLISTTDALHGVVTNAYDLVGNLIATTDAEGRTTAYAYDALNRRTVVTDALDGVTAMTYDAVGNPLTTTDAEGRTTTMIYDALDRLVRVTNALTGTTLHAYDAVGNRTAVTDAEGGVTRITYDALDRPVRVVDALGGETLMTYDAVGNLIAQVDPEGGREATVYDALDRRVAVYDALGQVTRIGYDAVGNVTVVTDANGSALHMQYDAVNQIVIARDGLGRQTHFAYDGVGNQTVVTDAAGAATTFVYDAVNRPVRKSDPLGNVEAYGYDRVGNQTVLTDAMGVLTHYHYDALDRLIEVVESAQPGQPNSAAVNVRTIYAYDGVGNRTSVTDALMNTTTSEYDALNRLVTSRDPLGHEYNFSYDAVGNLLQRVDANGDPTNYVYDALNRVTNVHYNDDSNVAFTYDGVGNRLTMTDAAGTTRYEYDAAYQIVAVTDSNGQRVSYRYDAMGNRTALIYPDGKQTLYTYDNANQMVQVSDWISGVTGYTYDAVGRIRRVSQPNSVHSDYTYDAAGRIVGITTTRDGETLASYEYELDAMGNRRVITENVGAPGTQLRADFAGTPVSGTAPLEVQFTDLSTGNPATYFWTFGDGATSSLSAPVHTYEAEGVYTVTLTVTTADGASDTEVKASYIEALPCPVEEVLGEDTAETNAYRGLRDNVFSGSLVGEDYIAAYNRYAAEVTWILMMNPDLRAQAADLLNTWASAVDDLARLEGPALLRDGDAFRRNSVQGDATTRVVTEEDVTEAQAWLEALAAKGSPALQAEVDDVVAQLDDFVGKTPQEIWWMLTNKDDQRRIFLPLIMHNAGATTSQTTPSDGGMRAEAAPSEGQTDILTRVVMDPTLLFMTPMALLVAFGRRRKSKYWAWPLSTLLGVIAIIGVIVAFSQAPALLAASAGLASGNKQTVAFNVQRVIRYDYDALYRLTSATYTSGETFRYAYDAVGNRVSSDEPSGKRSYTYDAANRLLRVRAATTTLNYVWDNNGNLLYDGAHDYEYDLANRLTRVVLQTGSMLMQTQYTYAGDGVRLTQNVGTEAGVHYVVDRAADLPQVLQEVQTGNRESYLYGLDVIGVQDSGNWAYHQPDALGSVRQLSDEAGDVLLARAYAPFGEVMAQVGELSGSFGFAGEQEDVAARLQFLRARYYDPLTGRFITRDPYPAYATVPSTLHRYTYVGNNPVNQVDPSGLIVRGMLDRSREYQNRRQAAQMTYNRHAQAQPARLVNAQSAARGRIAGAQSRFANAQASAWSRFAGAQTMAWGRLGGAQSRFANANARAWSRFAGAQSWAHGQIGSAQSRVSNMIHGGRDRMSGAIGSANHALHSAHQRALSRINSGFARMERYRSGVFGGLSNGMAGMASLGLGSAGNTFYSGGPLPGPSFSAPGMGVLASVPGLPSYSDSGFGALATPSTQRSYGNDRQGRIAQQRANHIQEISDGYQEMSKGKLPPDYCERTKGNGPLDGLIDIPLIDKVEEIGSDVEDFVEDLGDELVDLGDSISDAFSDAADDVKQFLKDQGVYDDIVSVGSEIAEGVEKAEEWLTKNADTVALVVSVAAVGVAIVASGGAVLPMMAMGAGIGAVSGTVEYAISSYMAGESMTLKGLATAALGGAVGGAVQGAFGLAPGSIVGGFASAVISTAATNLFDSAYNQTRGKPGVSITEGLFDAGVSGAITGGVAKAVSGVLPDKIITEAVSEGLAEGIVSGGMHIVEKTAAGEDWRDGFFEAVIPSMVSGFVEGGLESGARNRHSDTDSASRNRTEKTHKARTEATDNDVNTRATPEARAQQVEARRTAVEASRAFPDGPAHNPTPLTTPSPAPPSASLPKGPLGKMRQAVDTRKNRKAGEYVAQATQAMKQMGLSDLDVDVVKYDRTLKSDAYFDVDQKTGERMIVLGPKAFGKVVRTSSGFRKLVASHELGHAQRYNEILQDVQSKGGDWKVAEQEWRKTYGWPSNSDQSPNAQAARVRYAKDEVRVEQQAHAVAKDAGWKLLPVGKFNSWNYVRGWKKAANTYTTGSPPPGVGSVPRSSPGRDAYKIVRQDDDFYRTKNRKDIPKSHLDEVSGDLVPANPDGNTTVLEHVYGMSPAKDKSPYTSFLKDDGDVIKTYGATEIELDLPRLQKDIEDGVLEDVKVLTSDDVQQIIEDEIAKVSPKIDVDEAVRIRLEDVPDYAKSLGLSNNQLDRLYKRLVAYSNTVRDQEYLIRGIIPSAYIYGPYATGR